MIRALESIPCPAYVAEALDARIRRRHLLLQIEAVSSRTTATIAHVLAWALALRARTGEPIGAGVERRLRTARDLLLAGWGR